MAILRAASARWMKQIVGSLEGQVPVIVFSKGTHGNWDELVATGAQVLGVDWNVRLADVARAAARPAWACRATSTRSC